MRRIGLVFAGGFCGTLARYLLLAPLLALAGRVLPTRPGDFPFDILLINLSGALALGLLYGLVEHGARVPPDVRLAVGTGFLGAYTTFSTFVYGGDRLLAGGAVVAGAVYLGGSIVLGVSASSLGFILAGLIGEHRSSRRRWLVRARRTWRWARTTIASTSGAATSVAIPATTADTGELRNCGHSRGSVGTGSEGSRRDTVASDDLWRYTNQDEEWKEEQEVR